MRTIREDIEIILLQAEPEKPDFNSAKEAREYVDRRIAKIDHAVQKIRQLIHERDRYVIGKGKAIVLSKTKLEYGIGWCDGREKLRDEQEKRAEETL